MVHYGANSGNTSGIDQALKSLQRKIQKDAIVRELKAARYYEKPSEKKRRKHEESDRRRKKINKKMRDVGYRGLTFFHGAHSSYNNCNENAESGHESRDGSHIDSVRDKLD